MIKIIFDSNRFRSELNECWTQRAIKTNSRQNQSQSVQSVSTPTDSTTKSCVQPDNMRSHEYTHARLHSFVRIDRIVAMITHRSSWTDRNSWHETLPRHCSSVSLRKKIWRNTVKKKKKKSRRGRGGNTYIFWLYILVFRVVSVELPTVNASIIRQNFCVVPSPSYLPSQIHKPAIITAYIYGGVLVKDKNQLYGTQ